MHLLTADDYLLCGALLKLCGAVEVGHGVVSASRAEELKPCDGLRRNIPQGTKV